MFPSYKKFRAYTLLCRYRLTKIGFAGPKSFQGFRENGPLVGGFGQGRDNSVEFSKKRRRYTLAVFHAGGQNAIPRMTSREEIFHSSIKKWRAHSFKVTSERGLIELYLGASQSYVWVAVHLGLIHLFCSTLGHQLK